MGQDSGIQWTDHTFNPWMGCQRVSPGCEHCYAETLVTGRMKLPVWGPAKTTERKRTAVSNWRKPLAWNRAAEKAGKPARVFCASLADVFEDHLALAPWRADLFALIEQTPYLTWQLLTKRPENLRKMLPPAWLETPRPNVWLGCTVEDQQRAAERIPRLLDVPAAVHFLSCEPLLEHLSLGAYLGFCCDVHDLIGRGRCTYEVDWLIVGGESGAGARPFHTGWARSLVAQCRSAGVPIFVKQFGARPFDGAGTVVMRDSHGGDLAEFPEDLRVREFPAVRS